MTQTGRVIKILSEYCYVEYGNNLYECKARGIFRHSNERVITGDKVEFEITNKDEKTGTIIAIEDRVNELYRPKMANIDQVVIVTSVAMPDFNSFTLDKYLAMIEYMGLKPVLAFTKTDLIDKKHPVWDQLKWYSKIGYDIYFLNNNIKTDDEWIRFEKELNNKISVFTGQTGAGKSTTLNHLLPNVFEKTQEISKALNRGKHTTTKNELFKNGKSYIADTPGFSSFELKDIDQIQLAQSYKFFADRVGMCKFRDCIHVRNAIGCVIVKAVVDNEFPEFIYEDYLKMQNEIKEKQKRSKW